MNDFRDGLLIGGFIVLLIAIWAAWSSHHNERMHFCSHPPEPVACCQAMTEDCIKCNQESQKRLEQYKNMCE